MLTNNEVRSYIEEVEQRGISESSSVAKKFESAGYESGKYVGRNDLNPEEIVVWYVGQFLSIVEDKAWFAMNSLINCLDKFVPVQEP